jgi:hypothetical protein
MTILSPPDATPSRASHISSSARGYLGRLSLAKRRRSLAKNDASVAAPGIDRDAMMRM